MLMMELELWKFIGAYILLRRSESSSYIEEDI